MDRGEESLMNKTQETFDCPDTSGYLKTSLSMIGGNIPATGSEASSGSPQAGKPELDFTQERGGQS